MGDPRHQLAERGHLGGLHQLALRLAQPIVGLRQRLRQGGLGGVRRRLLAGPVDGRLASAQLGLDPRGLVLQQLAPHHGADPQADRLGSSLLRHQIVDPGAIGPGDQQPAGRPIAVAEPENAQAADPGLALPGGVQRGAQRDAVEAGRLQIDHDAIRCVPHRVQRRFVRRRGPDIVPVAPHQAGQGLGRFAGIADQQHPGLAEQPDLAAEPDRFRLVRAVLPQQRPDPEQDQRLVGRFRHVGVGAALQPLALEPRFRGLRQHQHRRGASADVQPQRPDQLAAIHARQMVVAHHQLRHRPVQAVERRLRAVGALDREAVALQHAADHQRLGVGILDQQDPAAHGAVPARGPSIARMRGAICSIGRLRHDPPRCTAAAGMP